MPHSRIGWARVGAATLVMLLAVVSCGGGGLGGRGSSGRSELTVFAAASLTESFRKMEQAFDRAHPDIDVKLNFAGSSSLARSIIRGAPAGVFASANSQQMRRVVQAGEMAGKPATFAGNRLQIAVPPNNPAGVQGLAAFGKENLDIALCAEQVPCGAASRKALRVAGVTPRADTLEQDVKAVLTKVRLGEVDAGLVYRTDVASAGNAVTGISFPAAAKAVNDYQIGIVQGAENAGAGRAFVAFVRSQKGQAIMANFGFDTKTP